MTILSYKILKTINNFNFLIMEENDNFTESANTSNGDVKTTALLSYITLIGWIIAVVLNSSEKNNNLATFHIRQSLGLMLTTLILIVLQILLLFIPFIGWYISFVLNAGYIAVFALWILGLISAANGEIKSLPVVGEIYKKHLNFIK